MFVMPFVRRTAIADAIDRACIRVEDNLRKEYEKKLADAAFLAAQEQRLILAEKDAEIKSLRRTNDQLQDNVFHAGDLAIKAENMVSRARRYAVEMTGKSELALKMVANMHQDMLHITADATAFEKEALAEVEQDKKKLRG